MTLQLHLGCNSRNLLGTALAIWLWAAAAVVRELVAVAAGQVGYLQHQCLYLLVRLTPLQ
jgi:hypothetical protein